MSDRRSWMRFVIWRPGSPKRVGLMLVYGVAGLSFVAGALAVQDFTRSHQTLSALYSRLGSNLDVVASLEYETQEARRSMLYALATDDSNTQLEDVGRS